MKRRWLALLLFGMLLFSLFGMFITTSTQGLYHRGEMLSTGGHYYLYGMALSELYAGCYGIDKPIPAIDGNSDLLEVLGARSNPDCLGDKLLNFEAMFESDDAGQGLTFFTDAGARGKLMEELAPNQPVIWLLTPSVRVPFFPRTFMRGSLRFKPKEVTPLKPTGDQVRQNSLEGSEN